MPTSRSTAKSSRPLTFTERARRAQLIEVTIDLVAEHGYGGTSLARIAESAGITKAAVLYHFPSKEAVVQAAHQHVLDALVEAVATAVEASAPVDGPAAYIRSMIAYLRDNPSHTRVIIEAMTETGDRPNPANRWSPLADLLTTARKARRLKPNQDPRTLAIIIGGAIDAIVVERLTDPAYDTTAAAETLITLIQQAH